jgi:hypothetical protein
MRVPLLRKRQANPLPAADASLLLRDIKYNGLNFIVMYKSRALGLAHKRELV